MLRIEKKDVPLIFLVLIASFWAFFYQSTNWLNDYGASRPEWLLLIDGLIILPLLCFICIENKKEALVKALVYSCLIIVLGSFVISESSKFIWTSLETVRYFVIAAFVIFEVVAILTVFFAIRAYLRKDYDPDLSISEPIENIAGKSVVSSILRFEARVWTYFLFSKRINTNAFRGNRHFTYHQKDGTKSNLLGFICLIAFELPVMHMVLFFIWSPIAANIVSILTAIGLIFFIAEYKAVSIRPISLSEDRLIVRYGVYNPLEIRFSEIKKVDKNERFIRRESHVRRFNLSGNPNVKIELNCGKLVYLGVDSPDNFITEITRLL